MKLSDLFQISTGYTFRDAIQTLSPGRVGVVQAGDINDVRLADIKRVDFSGQRHYLQVGDILMSARGKSTACTITPDLLPAMATSSVMVLRPRTNNLNSVFVVHYLNSRTGQAALAKLASGAYIKTLRIREVAELEIPLPSNEMQTTLAKLAENIDRQTEIIRKKQALYIDLWNAGLTTATKGLTS